MIKLAFLISFVKTNLNPSFNKTYFNKLLDKE